MPPFILFNITDNHRKIWGIEILQNKNIPTILRFGGRIGTPWEKLKKNRNYFKTIEKARIFKKKIVLKKLLDGYCILPSKIYFENLDKPRALLIQIMQKNQRPSNENHLYPGPPC